jgi:hypothetical protein
MKVHHYSKALSWITRPRVTETATLETYIPELDRMDFNPGGRVGMKPGGIVEPGVTHYGKYGPYTDVEAEARYGEHLKGRKWSELEKKQKTQVKDALKYDISEPKAESKRLLKEKAVEQQKWISDNASKYSEPKLMEDAFKKRFKIKNIADADIFKASMTFAADETIGKISG